MVLSGILDTKLRLLWALCTNLNHGSQTTMHIIENLAIYVQFYNLKIFQRSASADLQGRIGTPANGSFI